VNGRTRSFKGQIVEVEILSRTISFALISVHDQARDSRLHELLDLTGTEPLIIEETGNKE
jgi:hypothetical protein